MANVTSEIMSPALVTATDDCPVDEAAWRMREHKVRRLPIVDDHGQLQGIVTLGAFLKLTPYSKDSGISDEQVMTGVEEAIRKYFGKRGEQVVQDNLTCVHRGYSETQEITQEMIQG